MNLIVGKKYNILDTNAYYRGKCNSFCGQSCDCCGRELESGYLFHTNESDLKNVGMLEDYSISNYEHNGYVGTVVLMTR